jgi:hypothetical protein
MNKAHRKAPTHWPARVRLGATAIMAIAVIVASVYYISSGKPCVCATNRALTAREIAIRLGNDVLFSGKLDPREVVCRRGNIRRDGSLTLILDGSENDVDYVSTWTIGRAQIDLLETSSRYDFHPGLSQQAFGCD